MIALERQARVHVVTHRTHFREWADLPSCTSPRGCLTFGAAAIPSHPPLQAGNDGEAPRSDGKAAGGANGAAPTIAGNFKQQVGVE